MTDSVYYRNKLAIAILRVSSRRQMDGISHDVQLSSVKEYCEQLGLTLNKTFVLTESAKDSNDRVKYREAMSYALKSKIGNILFYMPDRETRNLTDLEENEKLVLKGEFNLHYVRDRKILHRDSAESDFLTRDFSGIMARGYIRTLRIRVIDAMRRKAETGWYPSNHPPLGYVCQKLIDAETGRIKNRGGTIAPDPNGNNIKTVRREFELRAEGHSYTTIREMIVQEGLIQPHKIKFYHRSAIEARITNPFYRGQFVWEGKTYNGKHPLIIDRNLLERVDQTLGKRGAGLRREQSDHTALAGGWLKCVCGCHIVYDPKKKLKKATKEVLIYHYYHCSNGTKAHENLKGLNVSEANLWEQFGGIMDEIDITKQFADDIADALNKAETKAHRAVKLQIEGLKDKEKELEGHEDRLLVFLMDGTLDKPMYDRQIERVRENRTSLIRQLEVLQLGLTSTCLETAKTILELATSAKSQWIRRSAKERREFLDQVLSNPILNGTNIEYTLKKPFAVLVKMRGN